LESGEDNYKKERRSGLEAVGIRPEKKKRKRRHTKKTDAGIGAADKDPEAGLRKSGLLSA